jgi:hypothetical protein
MLFYHEVHEDHEGKKEQLEISFRVLRALRGSKCSASALYVILIRYLNFLICRLREKKYVI